MRCIRLRPEVSKLSTRPRAQLAIHGAAVAALVPALIWLVPESRWDRPGLLLVLIALAVIADFNEIPLLSGLRFDAGLPIALITLAVLGPLPAILVDLVPIAVGGLVRHERIIRPGNLANVAAYGWETVAAAALLAAAGVSTLSVEAVPWLLLAGAVMMFVNFWVGPGFYVPLHLGHPASALPRMFADTVPATLVHGRAGHGHGRARRPARPDRPGALRTDRGAAADRR